MSSSSIKNLSYDSKELTLDWHSGEQSRLHCLWLRDHCQNPQSRDPNNGQRLMNVTDFPANTSITSATLNEAGLVEVTFAPEQHVSLFKPQWLYEHCYCLNAQQDNRSETQKTLWQGDTIRQQLPEANYDDFCQSPETKIELLKAVQDKGFMILHQVPTQPGQILEVIKQFGFTRSTNYGDLFDVRPELDPNNLAFTNLGVNCHTDNPYRDPLPSVQLLHCLDNSAEGGESVLIDGFEAANILREEMPDHFATLSNTWINYRFKSKDADLRSRCAMIETNDLGMVIKVRFNNRSIAPLCLAADTIEDFYAAYRYWAQVLERDHLKLTFKMEPGDLIAFDNTRTMHARTAFSEAGSRHLQGAYTDLDGLLSSLYVLQNQHQGA